MKILSFILILLFGIYSFSCSKSKTFEKPNTPPILNISQDAQGMWEVQGKTLFFRLFDNGYVEFEYQNNEKKNRGKSFYKTEEVNSLVQTTISEAELYKFVEILNSNEFKEVENTYERKCCCTDATLEFDVNSQNSNKQKNINLIIFGAS